MTPNTQSRTRRGAECLARLQETVLLADGAMGTAIYERGVFINHSFDALCLSRPDLVSAIHREYLAAGADLLETNSFGANHARLLGHGLENQVGEINRAAVRLAREAAGERAYVAGSIGPVGVRGQVAGGYDADDLTAIFREQAAALLEAGVDCLIVETIPALLEMEAALAAIRGLDSSATVIALMTFNDEGVTQAGEGPEEVAERLMAAGAAVIGANCSVGPRPMLDCIVRMHGAPATLLAAMPNAGLPQSVESRLIYMASPAYFAKYARRFVQAGVRLLGGCCGTTPAHVQAMRRALAALRPPTARATGGLSLPGADPASDAALEEAGDLAALPTPDVQFAPWREAARRRTGATTRLSRWFAEPGRFVTSVELTPPASADLAPLVAAVAALHAAGVNAVNIPEYARISPRVTPLAIARAIQDAVPIETIVHYCCRDRNLYGMQADLMAAHALGVGNILIITGDPPKAGEYAVPTAVFDVDAIGLTGVARGLVDGVDAAGRATGVPLALHLGVGVNPAALDLERELDRFRRKVAAGAAFTMTQPVFDPRHLENFLRALGEPPVPVLVGVLPLYSYRNAEFLHNEVPGMNIPEPVRERMRVVGSASAALAEGVAIARDALDGVRSLTGVAGAYVMPPFGRYDLALRVLGGDA
ncbi:MAG: bifunctional homocysteine S-methyltransferase/methylenetetrahydrofolate reductase [Gemmatimonadota bacterium]